MPRLVRLDVEVSGEITAHDVSVLRLAALTGVLRDVVAEPVTYVNAPVVADARGIEVRLLTEPDSPRFRNLVTLVAALEDGTRLSVGGTLTGPQQVAKLVEIDGYALEIALADHLLVLRYSDRPGVVGAVGVLLGEADVNIAAMQVGPRRAGRARGRRAGARRTRPAPAGRAGAHGDRRRTHRGRRPVRHELTLAPRDRAGDCPQPSRIARLSFRSADRPRIVGRPMMPRGG